MAIDIFKWRSMTDAVENQVTTVPSGLVDLVYQAITSNVTMKCF